MTDHEEKKACCAKKGLCCPLSGCPITHVLVMTLLVAIASFAFDFLFHGTYMKPMYEATASMWRTEAEMEALGSFCIVYHLVFALAVSGLYGLVSKGCTHQGRCFHTGIRFGLLIGLAFAVNDFATYIWLPLDNMDIPVGWAVGRMIWGVLIGLILAVSCRILKKKDA